MKRRWTKHKESSTFSFVCWFCSFVFFQLKTKVSEGKERTLCLIERKTKNQPTTRISCVCCCSFYFLCLFHAFSRFFRYIINKQSKQGNKEYTRSNRSSSVLCLSSFPLSFAFKLKWNGQRNEMNARRSFNLKQRTQREKGTQRNPSERLAVFFVLVHFNSRFHSARFSPFHFIVIKVNKEQKEHSLSSLSSPSLAINLTVS